MNLARIVHFALAGISAFCIMFSGVQFGLRLHASSVVTPEGAVALYGGANVSGQLRITMSGDYEVTREDGQVFAVAPHEAKAVLRASPAPAPSPWLVLLPSLVSLAVAAVVLAWMISTAPIARSRPIAPTSPPGQSTRGGQHATSSATPSSSASARTARPASRFEP